MSRSLGPVQRHMLCLVAAAPEGMTVAALSSALDLTPRRCRQVVDSLRGQGVVTTREQIGRQATGLPVWGTVVWTPDTLFKRDVDRWNRERGEAQQADLAQWLSYRREKRCPCCGQALPSGRSAENHRAAR